jgi:hypothetical protein
MPNFKKRKMTSEEKEKIDSLIKKKVSKFRGPKAASCDYHDGACVIPCNTDPIGTADCPPCPPGSSGDGA